MIDRNYDMDQQLMTENFLSSRKACVSIIKTSYGGKRKKNQSDSSSVFNYFLSTCASAQPF